MILTQPLIGSFLELSYSGYTVFLNQVIAEAFTAGRSVKIQKGGTTLEVTTKDPS